MDAIRTAFQPFGFNTPEWSLQGQQLYGRIVDIYDGDTVTVVIPVQCSYYKYQARLEGIDTCEMKSTDVENKKNAIKARNRLMQLCGIECGLDTPLTRKDIRALLDKQVVLVFVTCGAFDKYGRLLVSLSKDKGTQSFSQILLNEKLAYAYQGDTKLTEEEQKSVIN